MTTWTDKIKAFCDKYNIPIEHLSDVLYEPKVILMIRGKAFEFSVFVKLREILPSDEFEVNKVPMNAQLGLHDQDVTVTHKPTSVSISVECKLAAKNEFRFLSSGHIRLKVKCMRSRTLGEERVKSLAPLWGLTEELLQVHNDQYLPTDFDVVVTSIGNTFYRTDPDTGYYEWSPTDEERSFLEMLKDETDNLKDFAFSRMYVAQSSELAVSEDNGLVCTRRKCPDRTNCGFIPNYPMIHFSSGSVDPDMPWVMIDKSVSIFRDIAYSKLEKSDN